MKVTITIEDIKNEITGLLSATNCPGIEGLIAEMEKGGFFSSACSTRYHLAVPGGLAIHSLNVFHTLVELDNSLGTDLDYTDMVIVSLLHDLGKMGDYGKPKYIEAPLLKGGKLPAKPFIANPEMIHEEHEIKSIQIASRFIELSEEQTHAILHHNGLFGKLDSSYNPSYDQNELTFLLHTADMYCSRFWRYTRMNGMKSKADFVEELKEFYIKVVGNIEEITDMSYIAGEDGSEYVYVSWGDSQKRFSVWGDNNQGILKDFVRFLNNFSEYSWLKEEERR